MKYIIYKLNVVSDVDVGLIFERFLRRSVRLIMRPTLSMCIPTWSEILHSLHNAASVLYLLYLHMAHTMKNMKFGFTLSLETRLEVGQSQS
jgi:hypothetical protein